MRSIKIIVILSVLCINAFAQKQVNSVAEGQAIFLYNFTKLIDWPENRKENQFIIGILGDNEIYDAVKEYTKQKNVAGKSITVKYFRKAEEVDKCHMLMVASSAAKEMEAVIDKAEKENILLVAERSGAIDKGVAINFLVVDGKIKYEVKAGNLAKCQLKYVSQLEGLAYKRY